MKHIKYFENVYEPQVGDYVICEEEYSVDDAVDSFIKNTIGIIIDIKYDKKYPYIVAYENIPDAIRKDYFTLEDFKRTRQMMREEIIHFSKNKEDLEYYIQANKYNL
jgi:hypothetical protein